MTMPRSSPDTSDPMDDLIYRLRYPAYSWTEMFGSTLDKTETIADMAEAADEIERLRAGAAQTSPVQIVPVPLWAIEDLLKWMRRQKDHETFYPLGLENLLQALISPVSSTDQREDGK